MDINKVIELKTLIIDAYKQLSERSKGISNEVGLAYCNAKLEAWAFDIQAIDKLIKGEDNMITIKDKLVTQIVRLDEIQHTRKRSELENKIIEDVDHLQQLINEELALSKKERRDPRLPALKIDNTKLRYNHYSGKISTMKKLNKLPPEVRVIKSGEEFYLAIKK